MNPPHTPVFQKSTVFPEILSLLLANPTIKPIKIAPKTFVIRVKMGNSDLIGIRLIAYLAIAPIAPPIATNRNSIINVPPCKVYNDGVKRKSVEYRRTVSILQFLFIDCKEWYA